MMGKLGRRNISNDSLILHAFVMISYASYGQRLTILWSYSRRGIHTLFCIRKCLTREVQNLSDFTFTVVRVHLQEIEQRIAAVNVPGVLRDKPGTPSWLYSSPVIKGTTWCQQLGSWWATPGPDTSERPQARSHVVDREKKILLHNSLLHGSR